MTYEPSSRNSVFLDSDERKIGGKSFVIFMKALHLFKIK